MAGITKTCPGYAPQVAHTVDISRFSIEKARADGYAPYCKSCAAARQRAWKQANPDKVRAAKRDYRARERAKEAA